MEGLRFFRQYSVGPFILDFYCPAVRVAIEVDGSGHFEREQEKCDQRREGFLKGLGIHVVRFSNADVNINREGVFEEIRRILMDEKKITPLKSPLILRGEVS